jgi:putative membrane protein
MKRTIAVLFSCALLPALSAAKAEHKGTMSDQEFVDFAAQTDMMEAHLGQMTQDQAGAQGVKDYGQMLTTDHTSDYNQLTAVAGKANLNVPKGLDSKHDAMIAPLEKLHGMAFDRRFEHEMVMGHEAALAVYKRESNDAQNPDIKTYAAQVIPTLEKHLSDAKALEKTKDTK